MIDLTDFLNSGSCPENPEEAINCGLSLVATVSPQDVKYDLCKSFDGCSAGCSREYWTSARSIFQIVPLDECINAGDMLLYGQQFFLKVPKQKLSIIIAKSLQKYILKKRT